jgi:hypothetical protein
MKAKVNTVSTEEINTNDVSTNTSTSVEGNSSDMTTDADIPLLDRDTYRRIKKMDRASLETLIQDIHESGRQKGLKEAVGDDHTGEPEINLDLRELEKRIKAVKGVGEKRAEEIMGIVEKWLGLD